jgi:hypothetical protein
MSSPLPEKKRIFINAFEIFKAKAAVIKNLGLEITTSTSYEMVATVSGINGAWIYKQFHESVSPI